MPPFTVHWSPVATPPAALAAPTGCAVVALWPAPVNADACFTAAGFTDFDDHDAAWEARAEALRDRVLAVMARHGPPRLVSAPLRAGVPWYLAPFRTGAPLPLPEQLAEPMAWDSLPACRVAFGDRGAALRVGDGHQLYWLILPAASDDALEALVREIAEAAPVRRTGLAWAHLLGAGGG